ncbi:hypothetical protein [Streptomyces sp. NBC_01304]|uniref:hypothetical protein n=1 Tax=Streptomyces sp. NBC_01304 TaxID=2903818 RepID=UPI002E164A8D|nr:hypothetical protein OG430_24580 [Streptomyces sp. NBC_01304]
MRSEWYGRIALAAAAVVLLGACGDGGGQAESPAGKQAAPLTAKQVGAVLPDAAALPGWKGTEPRAAESIDKHSRPSLCGGHKTDCAGLRYFDQAHFTAPEQAFSANLTIFAAQDEASAKTAYDQLVKRLSRALGEPSKIEVGELGDERGAVRGLSGQAFGPAAHIQVRTGTSILQISAETLSPDAKLDLATVKDLAALVTKRSEQVARGDTPSAVLGN